MPHHVGAPGFAASPAAAESACVHAAAIQESRGRAFCRRLPRGHRPDAGPGRSDGVDIALDVPIVSRTPIRGKYAVLATFR